MTRMMLATALALALWAPAAHGALVVGDVTSPVGDLPPGLDIAAAHVELDQAAGAISGSLTMAALPSYPQTNFIAITLGRADDRYHGECREVLSTWVEPPSPDAPEFTSIFTRIWTKSRPLDQPFATTIDGTTVRFSSTGDPELTLLLQRSRPVNCLSLVSSSAREEYGGLGLGAGDYIRFGPMAPPPVPSCAVAAKHVRAGRSFVAQCSNVLGRVRVSVGKVGTRGAVSGKFRVRRSGRLDIPTRKAWRGEYHFTLWKGDLALAHAWVRMHGHR